MAELEGLSGKDVTEEINGISVTLKPLTLKDLGSLLKAGSNDLDIRRQGLVEIVNKTIKQSYPKVKDPMGMVSVEYVAELVSLAMKANGMSDEEEETGPLETKEET